MDGITRRRVCRSTLLLLSGVAVSGCSSESDSSGTRGQGDAATVSGLEITYTDHEIVDEILARTPSSTEGTDGESTTQSTASESTPRNDTTPRAVTAQQMLITPSGDESILGLEFRLRNESEEDRKAPMPMPAPVNARGEISLAINVARYRQWNAPSIQIGRRAEVNGTTVDGLAYQLGQRQATISPDEEVTGWTFFPLPNDVDLSDVEIVISGVDLEIEGSTNAITWRVADP